LWICPSHRYFEWFIDVLRDVERKDVTNVLEMHIFITQFFHKFDLRTTMLVSPTYLFVGVNFCIHFLSPGAATTAGLEPSTLGCVTAAGQGVSTF
jgi:hypothetical protein